MSKLACTCGNVIVDQTDSLPYKAALIGDDREESFLREISEEVGHLISAAADGRFEHAMNEKYGRGPLRPTATEACYDILGSSLIQHSRTAYECTACGRLWIQKQNNAFTSYLPESKRYEAVFAEGGNR